MKSRMHRLLSIAVVVSMLLSIAGCGGGQATITPVPTMSQAQATPRPTTAPAPTEGPTTEPPAPQPPRLTGTMPARGEEQRVDEPLVLYFDQPMDQASVEGAFRIEPQVPGRLEWQDPTTLVFVPEEPLARGAAYRVQLEEDVASAEGLSPEDPLTFQFSTVGTLEVTDVVPRPDSIDVATDTVVRVVFNRPVVPLTAVREQGDLPDPLVFEPPVEGDGEWTNTSIYSFQPSEPLIPGIEYTVTLPAGLEDTTGGVLVEDYVWSFATELPRVVEVIPANEARHVPQDADVRVVFSQAMDRSATEDHVRLYDAVGEAVSGALTWDENTLIFQPLEPLAKGVTYRLEVTAGAPAASGEAALPDDLQTHFRVVAEPQVLGFSPQGRAVDPGQGLEITFSAPIDTETLVDNLTITPEAEFQAYWREDDTIVYVSTYLEPSTEYTVTLSTGILGQNGDPLVEEVMYSFTTRAFSPSFYLDLPDQVASYNDYAPAAVLIRAMNVEQLNLALYTISPEDFMALTGQDSWQRWQSYAPGNNQLLHRWTAEPDTERNVEARVVEDLTYEDGEPLDAGLYYLRVSSPQVTYQQNHLMVVTGRNVAIKSVVGETLAWVTDLQSGQPVEDAPLMIYGGTGGLLAEATTDAEGIAEVEHAGQEPWESLYVLTREGDALTVHMKNWGRGIQPWDYDLSYDPYPLEYRAMLYTDRQIYRPGQTVYLRGILRQDRDGDYSLPGSEPGTVALRLIDVEGREIYTADLPISEMGTVHGEFLLDAEAALGYYRLLAEYDEHMFATEFSVAEYRRPEFEVTVAADAPEYVQGDTIAVEAQASYYFGGPVANAQVRWSVVQSPYYFDRWEGTGNYSFADFDYESRWFTSGSGLVTEGRGETDAQGAFSFEVPADLGDETQSQVYAIEVAVTDLNNQEVSARASAIIHKGEFYIGVQPLSYVGTAGQPQDVAIITVDTQGVTVTEQSLTATLLQREWLSVREEADDGRFYWTNTIRETAVATETVTTDEEGYAQVTFTPEEGGSYRVLVTGLDERENEVRSSGYLWVSGREYVNWGRENVDAIELIADQDLYRPGETATVLIPSPYEGEVMALLTIERGRVIERQVMTLTSNSEQVEIPIIADYAPNVYVSVTIVQGMGEDHPTPSIKVVYVALPVSTEQQELTITITPDQSEPYRPRQEATFHVLAQNYEGEGVEAEMSLKLVDRAVEALTGGDPTDIVDAFYRQRPLGVATGSTLTVLVDRLLLIAEGEDKGGGGGPGDEGLSVRQDFRDTAYWAPEVRTDENGEATVTVTLPDNLTTWRMAAQAVTADTEVGMADAQVVSTLDVLIRPVAPRFMVIGDEPILGAIVHNNTDEALDLTAVLGAEGVEVQDAQQELTVAAGGREALSWPASVGDVGAARLRYSVSGGGYGDAIDLTLPVYHATSPEVVGTAGQVEDQTLELIRLPLSAERSQGDLTVHLEPSLAAGMREGLEFLKHYPYECVEQTVSRFLPNVVTYRALRALGIERPDLEETLPDLVGTALQRLYRGQNLDGGWGWWPRQRSDPLMTAYVVYGLVEANDAGFTVDEGSLGRGIDYLYSWLNRSSRNASPDLRATVLYSLAYAGRGDLGRAVALYDDSRHDMSLYALGFLAMTLEMMEPEETARLDDLANEFANAAIVSASGAHWEEEEIDRSSMNTNLRTSAIVLKALQ
ncbi:MAG: hypothetical protein GX649_13490, partial [Chloroflexi bacterium]|nr:hypothetical protein [Chloroflexota bacterium]